MKQIPLNHGKFAIVDDDMFEFLMQWKWYAHHDTHTWYAQRADGKKTIKMHRVILNASHGVLVDHRNGDGLFNLRENLRICTTAQNTQNAGPYKTSTTGFKGVQWNKKCKKYRAEIQVSGKKIHLGMFDDPKVAAHVYDEAAKKHFGEFAWTNFS